MADRVITLPPVYINSLDETYDDAEMVCRADAVTCEDPGAVESAPTAAAEPFDFIGPPAPPSIAKTEAAQAAVAAAKKPKPTGVVAGGKPSTHHKGMTLFQQMSKAGIPATDAGITRLQGMVDTKEVDAKGKPFVGPKTQEASKRRIAEMQVWLNAHGYPVGKFKGVSGKNDGADGVCGDVTIRQWKKAKADYDAAKKAGKPIKGLMTADSPFGKFA